MKNNRKYNILVTGVGAIIGYGIINSLRNTNNNLNIIGMDIHDDAYGSVLADSFVKAKRADDNEYIPFLNQVIKDYNIDLIIPGIEQDLYSIFENKEELITQVVLNNDLCINLSKDKLATYNYLMKNSNLNLIPTLHNTKFNDCKNKLGSPFILKPQSSYASKGIEAISSEEEFLFFTKKNNGNCIYQRIVGSDDDEYTVSIFGDSTGKFLDYIILKRKLSGEGATSKASLVEKDNDIINYIVKLCNILKPVGPTNIQIRKENNKVYLLEINPRISSSCSIRTKLGYNEAEMCIKYYLTSEIISPAPKKSGKIIRYISDQIIDSSNE